MKRIVLFFAVLFALLPLYAADKSADTVTATGTAFIISPDGYLLTCDHVVSTADSVSVTIAGKSYEASVLDEDTWHDLALLKVEATNLPCLPLVNSNAAQMGEELRVFGFPLSDAVGTTIKATRGTLSGSTTIRTQKIFQIDAPVNPGNSGGPVINENGAVLGVVNAKLAKEGIEGIGFAVPINYARELLRNNFVTPVEASASDGKLDGPTLVKHISPAVVLVTAVSAKDSKNSDNSGDNDHVYDLVKAQSFQVVDKDGTVRASLEVDKDNQPQLILFNADGDAQAILNLPKDDQPSFCLYGAKGQLRAEMDVTSEGDANMIVYDANTVGTSVALAVPADGSLPRIALYDVKGKVRGSLTLDKDSYPSFRLYDSHQKVRLAYGLLDDSPEFVLFNEKGESIWSPLSESGK